MLLMFMWRVVSKERSVPMRTFKLIKEMSVVSIH